jgi:O-antigen/teichoic acid export membrane protein
VLFFIDHGPDSKTIQILCLVIAISIPISTFGAIYRIELLIQNRFQQSSILSTLSTIFWQLEILYSAYKGYGAFSYIVPILLQAIFDGLMGWYFIRSWPIKRPFLSLSTFFALFKDTKLIMTAAFALSLALTGQYFVASLFASAATVGYFFFGFQNAYNVFILINVASESVLPTILTKIKSKEIQNKTVVDLLETFMVFISPVVAFCILLAPHLFQLIWKEKWMQSVFVFQNGLLSIPALLLISFVKSLHESLGQWKSRFVLMFIYGFGSVIVVALGSFWDHLNVISGSLTAFYFSLSIVILRHMSRLLDTRFWTLFRIYFLPIFISFTCVLAYYLSFESLSILMAYRILLSLIHI